MRTAPTIRHLLLAACLAGAAQAAPFRELPLADAIKAAATEKKIVVLDFRGAGSPATARLDKFTWANPKVAEWLEKNAVAIHVDVTKDAAIAARFAVKTPPAIVFLDSGGKELERLAGYRAPDDFVADATGIAAGKDAVARARSRVAAAGAKAAMQRMALGDALAAAGRNEDALKEYLWCFDEGDKADPAFAGVRRSFLLGGIQRLSKALPSALDQLKVRRDAAEESVRSGKGDARGAFDAATLNGFLGSPERTMKLYAELKQPGAPGAVLAEPLFNAIFDTLLEKRQYKLIGTNLTDVDKKLDDLVRHYDELRTAGTTDPVRYDESLLQFARLQVTRQGGKYFEALLGAGRREEAARVAQRLIAFDNSGQTYALLVRQASRAGAKDVANETAQRAMSTLSGDELQAVRDAVNQAAK